MKLDENWSPNRYAVIDNKCPREIVMLRGRGCFWQKCNFCDYHLDKSSDVVANFNLNKAVLDKVTGLYKSLEVINSGSFVELDENTKDYIRALVRKLNITSIYIECHYKYKDQLHDIKAFFFPCVVHVKLGVETFDVDYRENVLNKGIGFVDAATIAQDFEDCCLLVGMVGQTPQMIDRDIRLASTYFNRICINIFIANQAKTQLDQSIIDYFISKWYPLLKDDPRFDVLLENTAFGVGGVCTSL